MAFDACISYDLRNFSMEKRHQEELASWTPRWNRPLYRFTLSPLPDYI